MTQNENTTLKNEVTLSSEDASYCQQAFDRYADHLQFVTSIADDSFIRIEEHLSKYESPEPYAVEFVETRDTVTTLRKVQQKLTKSFSDEIEEYFHSRYNIDFDSLELKVEGEVVPLASYQPLVDNIIRQVGNNFNAAGREQIKQRFQKEFRIEKTQPVLKNNVIQLPFFASYYENKYPEPYINLKHDCVSVSPHLLDTINFFYYSSTQQPEAFTELVEKWRGKIDTDVWYMLLEDHDLQLKFFKNGRVNLMFKNTASARQFFEYFNLEDVAKHNSQKNS